jgi:hypothetical protein
MINYSLSFCIVSTSDVIRSVSGKVCIDGTIWVQYLQHITTLELKVNETT